MDAPRRGRGPLAIEGRRSAQSIVRDARDARRSATFGVTSSPSHLQSSNVDISGWQADGCCTIAVVNAQLILAPPFDIDQCLAALLALGDDRPLHLRHIANHVRLRHAAAELPCESHVTDPVGDEMAGPAYPRPTNVIWTGHTDFMRDLSIEMTGRRMAGHVGRGRNIDIGGMPIALSIGELQYVIYGPSAGIEADDVNERERAFDHGRQRRSEEHTSELQSLMRISYA